MDKFVGHLVPGLILTFLGLWHTYNTIKAYCLYGKANFISKFSYPVLFSNNLLDFKHLELILIFSFSILTIILQILDYPRFTLSFQFQNFEHATMYLHLAIYAVVSLSIELLNGSPDIFRGLTGALLVSVFSQELFLLHYHSVEHVGLEGHYHWLLELIVLVSLVSAAAMTSSPTSFTSALALSSSVVFQGCWFMIMGFALWTPLFVPKGCSMGGEEVQGAVTCETNEASGRARALANLQFSWTLAAISLFTASLCLITARNYMGRRLNEYEQLQIKVAEASPISPDIDGAAKDAKYSSL